MKKAVAKKTAARKRAVKKPVYESVDKSRGARLHARLHGVERRIDALVERLIKMERPFFGIDDSHKQLGAPVELGVLQRLKAIERARASARAVAYCGHCNQALEAYVGGTCRIRCNNCDEVSRVVEDPHGITVTKL